MEDYAGWWQLEAANKTVPFTCIEIPKDHVDEVRCYDKTGDRIDAGYADYNEQRARNGNPLIVFTFDGIGEFGANASGSADGTRWLELSYHGQWFSFYYQETPKF